MAIKCLSIRIILLQILFIRIHCKLYQNKLDFIYDNINFKTEFCIDLTVRLGERDYHYVTSTI
jgi:hypothetical protein